MQNIDKEFKELKSLIKKLNNTISITFYGMISCFVILIIVLAHGFHWI